MADLLQFNSQLWKLRCSESLKLFLPRSTKPDRVYFDAEWTFVHPDVSDEDFSLNHPMLHMNVMACVPGLRDWRDLAGQKLGDEDLDEEDDMFFHGPDLFVYPPKPDPKSRPDAWDTQFTFGARDEYEFEFEMSAFRPSDRAREANREYQVKQLMGGEMPPDWEKWDWLEEGDTLFFDGRIRLEEILCHVPINTAGPIEWARQLARKELKLDESGFCRVNGGDFFNGRFKPGDGIGDEGRLVVLSTATEYYYEWLAQQKKRQGK